MNDNKVNPEHHTDPGVNPDGDEQEVKDKAKRERWGHHIEFILASIGLAVGTGNVWRFPYLAQKNGGGAFLLPYGIMLLIEGLPLFYLELALGQRMQKGFLRIWEQIRPYFKGIGIGQVFVSLQMTAYFPMVMCWCMYYFYLSFSNPLPWTKCDNSSVNISETCCVGDESKYFWYVESLRVTPTISEAGGFVPGITICWFLSWFFTYICLFKGIKSSGKAAYFTATFPYVVLICLFFRGVTLPGAGDGVKVLFTPDFKRLLNPTVWVEAAGQIFYSLSVGFGALILFGSYNNVQNNCSRDAMIIALVNCGTSVFAAIVVYSILGFRQHKVGMAVTDVEGGPGLAFIAYTTAVAQMPLPQLWAAAFFFMMVLLAVDSEFGTIEATIGPLQDYPFFKRIRKELLCLMVCVMLCLLGLPMTLEGGLHIFTLWDTFSVSLPLVFIGIFECIAVSWFYGLDRFCEDIKFMTGGRPHMYWQICWKFVSPILISVVLVASIVKMLMEPPTYPGFVGCIDHPVDASRFNGTKNWVLDMSYPVWGRLIAATMVALPVVPVPLFAVLNWNKPYANIVHKDVL